jgi:hypothetical protein
MNNKDYGSLTNRDKQSNKFDHISLTSAKKTKTVRRVEIDMHSNKIVVGSAEKMNKIINEVKQIITGP